MTQWHFATSSSISFAFQGIKREDGLDKKIKQGTTCILNPVQNWGSTDPGSMFCSHPHKMASEEQEQKFHTDDTSLHCKSE